MTYDLACTVTGANGFVGRHLVDALLAQTDYKVRIFAVDLVVDHEAREENGSFASYFSWDVTQPLRSDFLAVDAVYHFAGIADPKRYIDDPIAVMDLNLVGLKNILERITLWGAHRPRIVYSSTSEVYGLNTNVPFDETASHVFNDSMRWCYSLSKLCGEFYLRAYAQQYSVRNTIFRFFNFVGDDIDEPGAGRVLTKMVHDALTTGTIKVTAPGVQTRCFTHIDDVMPVLVDALSMKRERPDLWERDYTLNLGNDTPINMLQLAKLVRSVLGKNLEIDVLLVPGEEIYGKGYDDVKRRMPKLDRVHETFGWVPNREPDEFLPDVIRAIADRVGVMA